MRCARCMEEITAPYFYNGKVYGWTCIKIVNPVAKRRNKEPQHWILADGFTVTRKTENSMSYRVQFLGRFMCSVLLLRDSSGMFRSQEGWADETQEGVYLNIAAFKDYQTKLKPLAALQPTNPSQG